MKRHIIRIILLLMLCGLTLVASGCLVVPVEPGHEHHWHHWHGDHWVP